MTKRKSSKRRRPKSTAPQVPPRAPRRSGAEQRAERPNAPWHPFPLVELCALVGIALIVTGFFSRDGAAGRTLMALGLALGCLAGLDTTVREHFSGFRSHSLVLAAFPAVATAIVIGFARVPLIVIVPVMLGVFLCAFLALRRVWDRTRARSAA